MLSRLFIAVLWSPAGKGLTSWLSFVMFNCVFVTFPCGKLDQVWYLIVSIPDLCRLSYFKSFSSSIGTLFPYGTSFRREPISERLSVHLDRYVETLSSAT